MKLHWAKVVPARLPVQVAHVRLASGPISTSEVSVLRDIGFLTCGIQGSDRPARPISTSEVSVLRDIGCLTCGIQGQTGPLECMGQTFVPDLSLS